MRKGSLADYKKRQEWDNEFCEGSKDIISKNSGELNSLTEKKKSNYISRGKASDKEAPIVLRLLSRREMAFSARHSPRVIRKSLNENQKYHYFLEGYLSRCLSSGRQCGPLGNLMQIWWTQSEHMDIMLVM